MANRQDQLITPVLPDAQVTDYPAAAKLLTAKHLGAFLSLSKRQISRLNAAGKLPRPIRIGGSTRWEAKTINLWISMSCPSRVEFEARNGGAQ